ncbi:hypothetical protein RAS2_29610 [Phycisphaerae bacterium RAS2]|nr:hypothetical protein RAS2_29610 [Phycisphaerae bacterium RAS2]
MTQSNPDNSQPESPAGQDPSRKNLVGRFVVERGGVRHVGLAAHEAMELLAASSAGETGQLLLIHRVGDRGTMELIGVESAALSRTSAVVYRFEDVRIGRAAYESLINRTNAVGERAVRRMPPPCRLEVRFARVPAHAAPVALVVQFPEPCFEAAMRWTQRVIVGSIIPQEAGRTALRDFDASAPQIMESATIEPE